MSSIKFKLSKPGLTELMKGGEMSAILNSAAQQVAAVAGDGYVAREAVPINYVAVASVMADSWSARWHNSKENTLLRAMGSVHL